MPDNEKELAQNWLGPQAFPLSYDADAVFEDGAGAASGLQGAGAVLTWNLNNFPHVAYRVSIVNTYALPDDPTADEVELFRFLKQYWDDEQTVQITLAQQNLTNRATHQATLQGRGGVHWHTFSKPYLFRGGNQIVANLTRLQSYPIVQQERITPSVRGTLVTAVLKKDVTGWGLAPAPGSTGRP